jgi:hypothetical protein
MPALYTCRECVHIRAANMYIYLPRMCTYTCLVYVLYARREYVLYCTAILHYIVPLYCTILYRNNSRLHAAKKLNVENGYNWAASIIRRYTICISLLCWQVSWLVGG